MPPTVEECPALAEEEPVIEEDLVPDAAFLGHLEQTFMAARAHYTTELRQRVPEEQWDEFEDLTRGEPLSRLPGRLAAQAMVAGVASYFDSTARLRASHGTGVIGAITAFRERHLDAVDIRPLLAAVEDVRSHQTTPYSQRLTPATLAKFLATQESEIRASRLPQAAQGIALAALARARQDPDRMMDAYADTAFLIQAIDFSLRTPGTAITLRRLWDAEMWWCARGVDRVDADDEHQQAVMTVGYGPSSHEVWQRLAGLLAGGLDPSAVYYELGLEWHSMLPADRHYYYNFIGPISQRMGNSLDDIAGLFKRTVVLSHDPLSPLIETSSATMVRLVPPTPFGRFLKDSHREFDGLIYQSREATPAEIVQNYFDRRAAVWILWRRVRFKDYHPAPWVAPFYFLAHDLYHAADKIQVLFTVHDAVRPLWRALGKMPRRFLRQAGMQAVMRLLMDLEVLGDSDAVNLACSKILLPLHLQYAHPDIRSAKGPAKQFEALWRFYKYDYQHAHNSDGFVAPEFIEDYGPASMTLAGLREYIEVLSSLVAALRQEMGTRPTQLQQVVEALQKDLGHSLAFQRDLDRALALPHLETRAFKMD